jgi:hypothetical protein
MAGISCRSSSFSFDIQSRVYRDSSGGIATRYRLDGSGIESRWGRDFPRLARPAPGSTHPPVQFFPRVKRQEGGVEYPPLSNAEIKERVELYLYTTSGPVVACSRVKFTFTFTFYSQENAERAPEYVKLSDESFIGDLKSN